MIHPKCFTSPYLKEQGEILGVSDLRNLEKCILALELTARLQGEGLDFVFKGGTSLLLHCDPAKRLSVDVDILSLEPLEKFQEVLGSATKTAPFENWEHQKHRDHEAPPTIHFKAFYTSAISREQENVQLDVICTESPYAKLIKAPVTTSFLEIEEETYVNIPCASSLLGDKIAAFAPTTIGFLYEPIIRRTGDPGEPRPIKIVKHLFDIAELTNLASDANAIISTYTAIHAEQLEFRTGEWSIEETLADTQRAAYHVCRLGGSKQNLGDETSQEHREILKNGISSLGSHLFNQPFQRADAQIAAAKATLTAQLIASKATTFDLAEFINENPDIPSLKPAQLYNDWEHISAPLKKGNIEAFRIWLKAQELQSTSP